MPQNGLTIITRIKSGHVDALEAILLSIGQDIKNNPLVRFTEMPSMHFACWVILKKSGTAFPDELVLEANFDGDADGILNELIQHGGAGLDAIYSHCEGCPAGGANSKAEFTRWLKSNVIPIAAFYVGCRGQSLAGIRNAANIRSACETMLDGQEAAGLRNQSPLQIRTAIQAFVRGDASIKPISSTPTLAGIKARSLRNSMFVKAILLILIILLAGSLFAAIFHRMIAPALALWLLVPLPVTLLLLLFAIVLRIHEIRDAAIAKPLEGVVDQRVALKEDVFDMNHMTTLTDIKSGLFRLATIKFVLWLIGLLARTVYITGDLGGIPTIHFARWAFIDNNRRLLFFSNYDGSWESYMGDFIDRANQGLTAIWGNTVDFPRTSWLVNEGARRVGEFKRWTRVHNVFNQVWYSAYPDQTIRNILQNITFREGLDIPMNETEAKEWLKLL